MSYLALLREIEKNQKRAWGGGDKSDKTPSPGTFVTFGTPPQGPLSNFAAPAARRRWLIVHPDGALCSHTFTPPATQEEVRRWHPDARDISPDEGDPAS